MNNLTNEERNASDLMQAVSDTVVDKCEQHDLPIEEALLNTAAMLIGMMSTMTGECVFSLGHQMVEIAARVQAEDQKQMH
jgi:hypothetical protein